MAKLEILIGMIASGKSTYCRKRAKEGAVIINDDAFTMALHAGDYSLYNEKLKPLYKALEIDVITQALSLGFDVVIDRPNLSRATRRRYIGLANCLDVPVVAVVFKMESPEVHAERRMKHDSRGYTYEKWLDIARFHASKYEPALFSEGFDKFTSWEYKDGK